MKTAVVLDADTATLSIIAHQVTWQHFILTKVCQVKPYNMHHIYFTSDSVASSTIHSRNVTLSISKSSSLLVKLKISEIIKNNWFHFSIRYPIQFMYPTQVCLIKFAFPHQLQPFLGSNVMQQIMLIIILIYDELSILKLASLIIDFSPQSE